MRTTSRTQKANRFHCCEVCECPININERYHKLVFFTRDEILVAKICSECFKYTEDLSPLHHYVCSEEVMHDLQAVYKHEQAICLAEAQADARREMRIFEAREAHVLNTNEREW